MLQVSGDNFEKEVAKSKLPVIVDFYADWCSPCVQFAPVFGKVAREFEGRVVFAKCNVDRNQEFAQSAGVMSIPCMIVYKDGREVGRIVGNQTEDSFRQQLNAML